MGFWGLMGYFGPLVASYCKSSWFVFIRLRLFLICRIMYVPTLSVRFSLPGEKTEKNGFFLLLFVFFRFFLFFLLFFAYFVLIFCSFLFFSAFLFFIYRSYYYFCHDFVFVMVARPASSTVAVRKAIFLG